MHTGKQFEKANKWAKQQEDLSEWAFLTSRLLLGSKSAIRKDTPRETIIANLDQLDALEYWLVLFMIQQVWPALAREILSEPRSKET